MLFLLFFLDVLGKLPAINVTSFNFPMRKYWFILFNMSWEWFSCLKCSSGILVGETEGEEVLWESMFSLDMPLDTEWLQLLSLDLSELLNHIGKVALLSKRCSIVPRIKCLRWAKCPKENNTLLQHNKLENI